MQRSLVKSLSICIKAYTAILQRGGIIEFTVTLSCLYSTFTVMIALQKYSLSCGISYMTLPQ